MVTYSDLIQVGIFIVALISLCYQIFKGRCATISFYYGGSGYDAIPPDAAEVIYNQDLIALGGQTTYYKSMYFLIDVTYISNFTITTTGNRNASQVVYSLWN